MHKKTSDQSKSISVDIFVANKFDLHFNTQRERRRHKVGKISSSILIYTLSVFDETYVFYTTEQQLRWHFTHAHKRNEVENAEGFKKRDSNVFS